MKINNKTRALIISPHPDDEAIGCGGLIAKCKKEKAQVLIVYVSVGDSRQLVTKKTGSVARINEIKRVEQLAGFKTNILYIGKEFCRLDTVPQKDLIEKIEDVIDKFKPNLLAIPSRSSYNQDHRAVYTACITALRPTPVSIRHFVDTVLVYCEPYFWSNSGYDTPDAFLDLSEKVGRGNLLDFKIKLYQCHRTQVRKDPFPRSIENLKRWAHIYGKEAGAEIAEAYKLIRLKIK